MSLKIHIVQQRYSNFYTFGTLYSKKRGQNIFIMEKPRFSSYKTNNTIIMYFLEMTKYGLPGGNSCAEVFKN